MKKVKILMILSIILFAMNLSAKTYINHKFYCSNIEVLFDDISINSIKDFVFNDDLLNNNAYFISNKSSKMKIYLLGLSNEKYELKEIGTLPSFAISNSPVFNDTNALGRNILYGAIMGVGFWGIQELLYPEYTRTLPGWIGFGVICGILISL